MFETIGYAREQLLTSDNEDTATERVEAARELIKNYNQVVLLLEAFARIAKNLPRY